MRKRASLFWAVAPVVVLGCGDDADVSPCGSETVQAFCERQGKSCGTFTGKDTCGESHTVECGTCSGVLTCGATVANVCGADASGLWVAPYHPSYHWFDLPAEQVPWSRLTHLIVGALVPTGDSSGYTLTYFPGWSLGQDTWNTMAQQYITAGHEAGVKVTCMLGGAGGNPGDIWNAATSDTAATTAFAANIVEFVQGLGFDGVDLDWEDNVDYPGLVNLAIALRAAWPESILTIPTGPCGSDASSLAGAQQAVDAFMPMSYMSTAQWGGWVLPMPPTPLSAYGDNPCSFDEVRANWQAAGVPANKIVMGVGGYGQAWYDSNGDGRAPIAPYTGGVGECPEDECGYSIMGDNQITYAWLANVLAAHNNIDLFEAWDDIGKVSYWHAASTTSLVTLDDGWGGGGTADVGLIFYETPRSMGEKVGYCREHGLKGMMFWTVLEMIDGSSMPILEALWP